MTAGYGDAVKSWDWMCGGREDRLRFWDRESERWLLSQEEEKAGRLAAEARAEAAEARLAELESELRTTARRDRGSVQFPLEEWEHLLRRQTCFLKMKRPRPSHEGADSPPGDTMDIAL